MSEITREDVMKKAEDRGWTPCMRSTDEKWYVMTHEIYPFVIELWPEENAFMFRYNIGLFVYQSSKCGSFTNDEHFNKFFREMRFMSLELQESKEIYKQRLEIQKEKKQKREARKNERNL